MARILLADDNDAIRCLLVRLFRSRGYEVVEATDGHQVLDHFSTGSFDVVLLGVRLACMDGWETCRQLRRNSHVPVLIMSANDHPTFVDRIWDCGASAFVAKPIEFESVLSWVDAASQRADQMGNVPAA
jgi:DNA-binding response OmpR family regulator